MSSSKAGRGAALAATLALAGLALQWFSAAAALAGAPVGFLSSVAGEVRLNGNLLSGSSPVQIGQVIETGEDGKCTLLLGRSNVVHLGNSSRLEVTQHAVDQAGAADTKLRLDYGTTRALVRSKGPKKSFQIRTRAAVMGVRGTHILIDAPADPQVPARFLTLEGVATVELNKPADSGSGSGGGAKPSPTQGGPGTSSSTGAGTAGATTGGTAAGAGTGASAGAPPAPPSGAIELKANQMLTTESLPAPGSEGAGAPPPAPPAIVALPPVESSKLANAIAPPPVEIRNAAELKQAIDNKGAPPPSTLLQDQLQRFEDRPRLLPLDPVADSQLFPVQVNFTGKYK